MPAPRKCTESTAARRLDAYAATSLVQRTQGEGLNSWVYGYENDSPLTKGFVACGIEIAVHLGGEWRHEDVAREARDLQPNDILCATSGVVYRHRSRGSARKGLQVGFVVFGETLRALERAAGGELRMPGDAGRIDGELVDFARAMASGEEGDVRGAVVQYVMRHADVVASPMVRAKHELERWFENDLPIPMLAESGGLSATAFTRQFLAAYGTTPARYRLMLRANAAARMLWMRPEMPIAAIAEACGFPNVSYFYRAFRSLLGLTPSEARERARRSGNGQAAAVDS